MTPRELPPTSPFAGDDGSADPRLAEQLAALAAGTGTVADVVAALAASRVLVPVLAHARSTEAGADGLQRDREAETGVVAVSTADGRTAMPVFSSTAAMAAWRAEARPVPATAPHAAASALTEGWQVLVLDPGTAEIVLPRTAVWALARGTGWQPAVRQGADGPAVDPEIAAEIARVVLVVPAVREAEAVPGTTSEVAVRLGLDAGLDRRGLDAAVGEVNAALAASTLVAERVDSIELRLFAR